MKRILVLACLGVLLGSAALSAGTSQDARSFETAMAEGDAASAQSQWAGAIGHYREALLIHPHHAQARFLLAMSYRESSRYYEARRNFRLALNARAADRAWESQCRLQIAACWEATHNYREALAEYRLALAADSGSESAKEGQKRSLARVNGPNDDLR